MNGFFKQFQRPVIFDGAMGTMIQAAGLKGVNEILNIIHPDEIRSIHRTYLNAGSDVVIANTFGASRISLADEGLADKVEEINLAAARIAREAADDAFKADGRPRYVAGELGPTSKLPSLGHIEFSSMEEAYAEQASSLIRGGVDLIIIGTSQDPLQLKAAASGAKIAMLKEGVDLPFIASVTVERSGTMLVGSRLSAALAAIEPYAPAAFGINCAVGPDLMEEYLSELSHLSPFPIICQPNAGLPQIKNGRAYYPLNSGDFARYMAQYAERLGVQILGGCCGTTPDHISALTQAVKNLKASFERPVYKAHCASLFGAVALDQEPKPLVVAERTNANGSKKFKELVAAEDWDGCVAHAREASHGAHVLDVAVALPGKNEKRAMEELVSRLVQTVDRPLMIDSTSVDAMEAALSHIGGRAIINSINLEDGGTKARKVIALAKRFGAVLMCLTIDEDGMATTKERKLAVAERLVKLAVSEGLRLEDLLIDPLVFTLASGDASSANAGKETLEAIGLIKKKIPGARVSLGISNVSFGLPLKGRRALTSYFLHRAIDAGADAAIVNAKSIIPIDRIDPTIREWVQRLVNNDASSGNPLTELIHLLSQHKARAVDEKAIRKRTPEERLIDKVIDGDKSDLEGIVAVILKKMKPRDVVNRVLMPAMKVVGERFGNGRMPLPFVLQSAETMRRAIDILSPHMKADEAHSRGTIVLATVRGDVHDIGKNLVDAILSNNGFKVVNLGIRQGSANVIDAVRAHNADAIGLSGLLVSSTEIMREDVEIFRNSNLNIPVLCGGAALTEKFTQDVLARTYDAEVYYCADAFDGLKYMEKICDHHLSEQK